MIRLGHPGRELETKRANRMRLLRMAHEGCGGHHWGESHRTAPTAQDQTGAMEEQKQVSVWKSVARMQEAQGREERKEAEQDGSSCTAHVHWINMIWRALCSRSWSSARTSGGKVIILEPHCPILQP